jgi:hypothetical protein
MNTIYRCRSTPPTASTGDRIALKCICEAFVKTAQANKTDKGGRRAQRGVCALHIEGDWLEERNVPVDAKGKSTHRLHTTTRSSSICFLVNPSLGLILQRGVLRRCRMRLNKAKRSDQPQERCSQVSPEITQQKLVFGTVLDSAQFSNKKEGKGLWQFYHVHFLVT